MTGFKTLLSKGGNNTIVGAAEMPEPVSPNICLDSRQFPDMKDWELGKEYTFKARYTAKQEKEGGHIHGDFEVVSAEGKPTEEVKNEDERPEEGEETEERDAETEDYGTE